MALGQRQGIDHWAPLAASFGSHFWHAAVPALLGHASLVFLLLGLARLSRRGLVHHPVGKRLFHLAVPRQLRSLLLLDGHGARRGPWRRLDALGLTRVLLASAGWYK
jgi:hypothetical protein